MDGWMDVSQYDIIWIFWATSLTTKHYLPVVSMTTSVELAARFSFSCSAFTSLLSVMVFRTTHKCYVMRHKCNTNCVSRQKRWLGLLVRWTYWEKDHCQMYSEGLSFCRVTGFDRLPRELKSQFNIMCSIINVWGETAVECLQPVIAEAAELHVASFTLSWLTSLLNPTASLPIREGKLHQVYGATWFICNNLFWW